MKFCMYTLYIDGNPVINKFSGFPDFFPIFPRLSRFSIFLGFLGRKIGEIGWIVEKTEDMW